MRMRNELHQFGLFVPRRTWICSSLLPDPESSSLLEVHYFSEWISGQVIRVQDGIARSISDLPDLFKVIQMYVDGASQPPATDRLNETYDTSKSGGQVIALALGFATQNIFLHNDGYFIAFLLVGLSSLVLIVHAFHLEDVPIVLQSPHPFRRVYDEFKPPTLITAISKICSSTAGLAVVTMFVPAVYNDLGIYDIHYYLFLMTPASVLGIFASYMLLRRSGRKLSLLLGSAIILICLVMILLMKKEFLTSDLKANKRLAIITMFFMCLYTIGHMVCFGPMPWICKKYPAELKWFGSLLNDTISVLAAYVIALEVLILYCEMKALVLLIFFAFDTFMVGFIILFIPETTRLTYDEILGIWKTHFFWSRCMPAT